MMNNVRDNVKTRRNIRIVVVCVLAFSAITIAALVNKLSQPRILNKYELRDYGALLLDEPRSILDFALLDHRGGVFTRDDLLGKWTIFFFGFTHCGDICPTTMSLLAKTYSELKPAEKADFGIVFVTVDPDRDKLPVLKDYVLSFNADFVGVTGAEADLISLAGQLQVSYITAQRGQSELNNRQLQEDQLQHSSTLILINPRGELHGYFRPPFAHGALRVVWRSLRASYTG